MDDIDKINQGQHAQRLLDDSVLAAAFADLEALYINDWKSTKVDDTVKREQAFMQLQALEGLKSQLQSYVYTGKIASRQLERVQKM
jgi:hypothetical protein